jgi:arylsulfate sulfotransferase
MNQRIRWIVGTTLLSALFLGCGGGSDAPPIAEQSSVSVTGASAGPSPFIQFVEIQGGNLPEVASVDFTIAAKPATLSKPVHVTQSRAYLTRLGHAAPASTTLKIPVFGLYAGYANQVSFDLRFTDGSHSSFSQTLQTAPYVDTNAVYDHLNILKARAASSSLGFDFFYLKSILTTPVVMDTDGQVRWIGDPRMDIGASETFVDGGFLVGGDDSVGTTRIELDGSSTTGSLSGRPGYVDFHHNIDPGKLGLLAEFDSTLNGTPYIETILAEMTTAGAVIADWDFGQILSDYMTSQGDDPTLFVRPGVDWFHMNASLYDPRDDSIIASSRENFLIKVDYLTKKIIWIFGDPTKYWYTFASLRAKALTLAPGGLYPIGQHGISITPDKKLLLFNNGYPSFRQPVGAPSGESRTYSAASAYVIDDSAMTATEAWRFDYQQSIRSDICGSAQQLNDGSVLINYSAANEWTRNRTVAIDAAHNVVFDFELPAAQCQASFNTQAIAFDALTL